MVLFLAVGFPELSRRVQKLMPDRNVFFSLAHKYESLPTDVKSPSHQRQQYIQVIRMKPLHEIERQGYKLRLVGFL